MEHGAGGRGFDLDGVEQVLVPPGAMARELSHFGFSLSQRALGGGLFFGGRSFAQLGGFKLLERD